jgi:fatty acid desaturase
VRKSVWQIVNSFVPFVVAWYLAYRALSVSYALTLALAAIGAGFTMRLFIIQHDCGHGSFFKSKTANDIVGSVIGVHHIHHLSPRTPNYLLQKCYDENPVLHKEPLAFWTSLRCLFLNLWDEQPQKLVSFRSLRSMPQAG